MTQTTLFETETPQLGQIEDRLLERGIETVIGVDEAGRGPLAGPVVAAATWLRISADTEEIFDGIDDSKKLDEATREQLYDEFVAGDHRYATASTDAETIDEINVLEATFRAMKQAVDAVIESVGAPPKVVLVDGNLPVPGADWNQRSVVKGDQRSRAIAAASVLAKVARDRKMRRAHQRWPHYGFASHKGYGTAQHRAAIEEHGPCRLHRRSFAGVTGASEPS